MTQAAQANLAEIETGRLATERAQHPDVRQYGSRMVREHTMANDALARLAESKGVSLPAEPDPTHQQLAETLEGLQGEEFDRAYMRAMVSDHQHAVAMFEREAETAEDPEVRGFAAELVPTLRDHLRMAQMIQRSLESGPAVQTDQEDGTDRDDHMNHLPPDEEGLD